MTRGQPVLHPAGLVPQACLVHDVGGCPEVFGEVTDSDAADGQFAVGRDGTVLGKEREQIGGRVGGHVPAP